MENGTTDPSTSNLIAIAKLYGISAEELLRSISADFDSEKPDEHTEEEN